MKNRALLEMSVETLDAAVAAVRGGSDRVELCEDLSVGGMTPNLDLIKATRGRLHIPIFVMIRPRGGDFCYSPAEFRRMKEEIAQAKEAGMDGVVLGILTPEGQVDIERTGELVCLARPLPATFHRAFDGLADLAQGLENVIATGATRVLTSGGMATADEGASAIERLLEQARDRIVILPGGGIRPANLSKIVRTTGAAEFHSGLSNLLRHPGSNHREFEAGVRDLIKVLENESGRLATANRET